MRHSTLATTNIELISLSSMLYAMDQKTQNQFSVPHSIDGVESTFDAEG